MCVHHYRIIFNADSKPIFTTDLGAGGEISAVKMDIFTVGFRAGNDNIFPPPVCNTITAGPYYRPAVKIGLG